VVLLWAPALTAQASQPLRKTDLIRMLTSGPLTNKQIALKVRRNCLSFTPSPRDIEDIKASTADSAVMNAIAACGRPGATLRIVVPRTVRAVAGTEITIVARVLRWDVPQSGVSLVLEGASGIRGGPKQNPGAGTDSTGIAQLRLPVGMEAGTYHLRLGLASGTDFPRAAIDLITTAPVVAKALVRPGVAVFREGYRSAVTVRVDLTDSVGRPAVGIPVELSGTTAELGSIPAATTDQFGRATLTLSDTAVHRGGLVGVYAARQLVGGLTVVRQTVVVSEERTQFVAGTNQRGVVHSAIRSPLILEVRDTAGRPVTHYPVTLAALNGTVSPTTTTTDSVGIVRANVTLGDRAGTVVVTATVARVAHQAMMYASPGPPQGLEVHQNGVAVNYVTISGRDSVALQVAAHDVYGNDVQVTGLVSRISEGGDVVALRPSRVQAVVVLEPRKTGSATLRLRGSGLESEVAVSTMVPPLVTGPWTYGVRAGGVAFNYGFRGLSSSIAGRPGFRGEVVLGREVAPGLRVQGGLALGVLGANARSAHLSVGLYQGLVRGEYALTRSEGVVPVVALGGGVYRIKSTDPTNMVYHTSWLYLFGAGIDFPVGPRLVGVMRLERQQLIEANSKYQDGAVGALTVLEVGLRVTP